MKQAIEVTRFLNYVNRKEKKLIEEYNAIISSDKQKNKVYLKELEETKRCLQIAHYNVAKLEIERDKIQGKYDNLLSSVKKLLPKIRINIYGDDKKCTPRFFKTGKWWSRETGGLETDSVNEMTDNEIQKAIEFYGTTKLPLMLPKSNRQKKEDNEVKKDRDFESIYESCNEAINGTWDCNKEGFETIQACLLNMAKKYNIDVSDLND